MIFTPSNLPAIRHDSRCPDIHVSMEPRQRITFYSVPWTNDHVIDIKMVWGVIKGGE